MRIWFRVLLTRRSEKKEPAFNCDWLCLQSVTGLIIISILCLCRLVGQFTFCRPKTLHLTPFQMSLYCLTIRQGPRSGDIFSLTPDSNSPTNAGAKAKAKATKLRRGRRRCQNVHSIDLMMIYTATLLTSYAKFD